MSSSARRSPSSRRARLRSAAAIACMLMPFALDTHAQDKPIATVQSANQKVRVDVLSLKRMEGNLLTMRWQVVNDDGGSFMMVVGNMRLVDLAGRREYTPGLYSSGCSARAGDRVGCWATFAAPPAGTRTMAAKFYEQFDLLTGIPVSD